MEGDVPPVLSRRNGVFFQIVAHEIDWTRPIEFLDKEFGKIAPDAVTGKRFADIAIRFHL